MAIAIDDQQARRLAKERFGVTLAMPRTSKVMGCWLDAAQPQQAVFRAALRRMKASSTFISPLFSSLTPPGALAYRETHATVKSVMGFSLPCPQVALTGPPFLLLGTQRNNSMSSNSKIDANRRNSQLSTGPRSDAGKSVVARNACKHNLTSVNIAIAGEDLEEFHILLHETAIDVAPRSTIDARSGEGSNGIYIRAKDRRDLRHKRITHHTASDTSQHAEQSRWDRTQMISQCFTCASYGKQRKSGGVEYEDGLLHTAHFRIPKERHDTRDDGNCYVPPILDRGGRKGTDENIANDPSKCCSRKGKRGRQRNQVCAGRLQLRH